MGFVKQVGQGLGLIQNDGPSAEETLALQQKANNTQMQTNLTQNRVNQVGPDGSSTWTQGPANADGSPGTWTQTTALSDANQKLYNTQQGLSQGLADASGNALTNVTNALANPLNTSGLPARANGPDASQYQTAAYAPAQIKAESASNGGGLRSASASAAAAAIPEAVQGASSAAGREIQRTFDTSGVRALPGTIDDASRRRVEEAIMSRINPQYAQDEASLRNRLLNSGIEVGTDAYNREMNNFSQRLNDARMQAVLAGGTEESRQVGLTQGLNAQEFGQAQAKGDFAQRADTTMAGNETAANIASANNATQARIASMNAANQAAIANAGYANSSSMFNAGESNKVGMYNAGLAQDTSKYNAGLAQDTAKFNTSTGLQAANLNQGANAQNYQMGLAGAQFQNANRDAALREEITLRQQPLAELNALRTGSQPGTPTFGSYYTNGMNPGNAQSATDAAQAAANAQQQQYGNVLGKVGSLFGF